MKAFFHLSLVLSAIAFFVACSSDDSASSGAENWVSNPASIGSEVYTIKDGDIVHGFNCTVYEGDSSFISVSTRTTIGIDFITTTRAKLTSDSVLWTLYLEETPSTKRIMEAWCMSLDIDEDSPAIYECTSNYIKIYESKAYSDPYETARANVKNGVINICKGDYESYLESIDSTGTADETDDEVGNATTGNSSCVPDTLYLANGSISLDYSDSCFADILRLNSIKIPEIN